jgi:hypothetical protein
MRSKEKICILFFFSQNVSSNSSKTIMFYQISWMPLALKPTEVLKHRLKNPKEAPKFKQLYIKKRNAIYLINMSPPGWPGVP